MNPRSEKTKLRPTFLNENKLSFMLVAKDGKTSGNLRAELHQVQNELKSLHLGEHVVNENKVSEFHEDYWKITFNSATLVVRAMYSIPSDVINCDINTISQERYDIAKRSYPTKLTSTTCCAHEIPPILQACAYFHERIQIEVAHAHDSILKEKNAKKKSPIMAQLEKELSLIRAMKETANPFTETPKSHLAYVALLVAHKTIENGKPESFIDKLRYSTPPEFTKYQQIIDYIIKMEGYSFTREADALLKDFNREVAEKLLPPPTSGSSRADEKSTTAGSGATAKRG